MGGLLSSIFGSGGPSTAMKTNAAQQQSLSNQLLADFGQRYGQQSQLFSTLQSAYSPIIAAGPGQQGFTSPVLAALNTQAINASGAAARNARQAAGNFSAGQNNTSGLTSGIQKQIDASISSSAANQLATAQNNITQKNYELGQQNYWRAAGGIQALAGEENPTPYSGQANESLGQNFSQNTKINDEVNAQKAALAGGITGLALDAATFGAGGIANLGAGESFGEGASDFLKGGWSALGGK